MLRHVPFILDYKIDSGSVAPGQHPFSTGQCRPIGREELQSPVLDSVRESFQGNHRHPLMNQRAVGLSGPQPNPEGSYTMKA